jgi:hypothetical protein
MKLIVFLLFLLGAVGCATVPKETVELSYALGQDIDAIHASYRNLIHKHFDNLRSETDVFITNQWKPNYLSRFIKKGNLGLLASNQDSVQAFEGVNAWVDIAIEAIENKRKELITPINKDEEAILSAVDDAFARIRRANETITAHLNSIRKVQEVQDNALKALNVKELRDQINDQLIKTSNNARSAIEKVAKADMVVRDVEDKKQSIIKRIKGE